MFHYSPKPPPRRNSFERINESRSLSKEAVAKRTRLEEGNGITIVSSELEEDHSDRGYVVKKEKWALGFWNSASETPTDIRAAYSSFDEGYIGDPKEAEHLWNTYGIKPQCQEGHTVCSIGFSESEQKWYGWSHRGIYGFGVGYEVKAGDVVCGCFEHTKDNVKPGFVANTLEECRKLACIFARELS